MPLWQLLLDAAGAVLVLVLLYGLTLVVRRRLLSRHGGHLRAQLPRPVREGRARLASRARPLLRRLAGVVPAVLALAAAQAGLAARRSSATPVAGNRSAPSGCRCTPTTSSCSATRPQGELEVAMSASSLMGLPVVARGGTSRDGDHGVRAPDATTVSARNAVAVVFVAQRVLLRLAVLPGPRPPQRPRPRQQRAGSAAPRGRAGSVAGAARGRRPDPTHQRRRGGPGRRCRGGARPARRGARRGGAVASVPADGRGAVRLRRRRGRLGRRDERRGRRRRAAARPGDHAALPRRLQPRHGAGGRAGRADDRRRRTAARPLRRRRARGAGRAGRDPDLPAGRAGGRTPAPRPAPGWSRGRSRSA